jgi:hypothetical protein
MNENQYELVKRVSDKCGEIIQSRHLNSVVEVAVDCRMVVRKDGDVEFDNTPLDMSGADLHGRFFVADLGPWKGANFRGANLSNSTWVATGLQGTNFEGADLTNSVMLCPGLSGACFRSANLAGSKISGYDTASFPLTDKTMPMAPVDFTGANLTGVRLYCGLTSTPFILTDAIVVGMEAFADMPGAPTNALDAAMRHPFREAQTKALKEFSKALSKTSNASK